MVSFWMIIDFLILLMYKLILKIITIRIMRMFSVVVSVLIAVDCILFGIYMAKVSNFVTLVRLAPLQTVTLVGMANFLEFVLYQDTLIESFHVLDAVSSLEKTIKTFKFLKYDVMILGPVISGACLLSTPWFAGDRFHFTFVALDEYALPCTSLLKSVYFFLFCYSFMSVPFVYFMFLYVIANNLLRYQALERDIEALSEIDVNTPSYQDSVGKELKSCIAQHVFLKSILDKANGMLYGPFFAHSILAMCFGGSIMAYIFQNVNQVENIRFITGFAGLSLVIYKFIDSGQRLEYESEGIYIAATNSRWYRWNKQNCVLLQILIIQSSEPLKISNIMVAIDNTLLIKVFKGIYSVGTFYLTCMKK